VIKEFLGRYAPPRANDRLVRIGAQGPAAPRGGGARAATRADERGVRHVPVSLGHRPGLAAAVIVLEG
jgi:hypothetical protein